MTLFLNSVRVDAFNRDTRQDMLHQCFRLVRLMMAYKEYREGKKECCPKEASEAILSCLFKKIQEFESSI
jgi:hypothetical protein